MVLGMSKTFVIVLAIAAGIGYGTHNWYNFLSIMIIWIVFKIIWNILT